MKMPRKTSLRALTLVVVLLVVPRAARATWIEGKVFCDDDGDSHVDAADTPLDGVTIEAVSQGASPGTTLSDTTGDAVPVSPAVRGYYRILLPQVDDTYLIRPKSGLPPGSSVVIPASGRYSVFIDSGTGDPTNARKTRNFLVGGCHGSTTSTVHTTPGSSTSSTTPTTGHTSTSTTPTGHTTTTSSTPTGGNGSTTTTPTSGNTTTTVRGPGGSPVPPNCGDGILQGDEECDDGNRVDGDGCDASCATEDTAETWSINLRVRPRGIERLDYLALLRDVPSALLGTAPVHLTLSSGEFQMLDAELPASAFRVKPQPVLAQPDGRLAKAVGQFGIWRIELTLTPVTGIRAYDAHLVVKGEMLPNMFAKLRLTTVIRIGDVVYTVTDPIKANRTGKFLRYIHPVLQD